MRTIYELKIDHKDSKANVLHNQWTKLLKRTFWQFKETAKMGNDSWRDWPDIESRIVMKNAMAGVYHSSRWPAVTIYFWKHKWSFAICINKYDMAPSKHSAPQIDGLYYGEKVLRSCCWLAGEKEELNDFLNDQTGRHTHTHTQGTASSPLYFNIWFVIQSWEREGLFAITRKYYFSHPERGIQKKSRVTTRNRTSKLQCSVDLWATLRNTMVSRSTKY